MRILKKVDKRIRHSSRAFLIYLKQLNQTEDTRRYIFHHIPKCAGTSGVDSLTKWFVVIKDYPKTWNSLDCQKFCDHPKNLNELKYYHLLVGHYKLDCSFLHVRYPSALTDSNYRVFTFLRNPLELQISLYYWELSRDKNIYDNRPLEEVLLMRPNYIAKTIPCNSSNYKSILERYFYIGFVEKYQESFDCLAELIDKPKVDLKTYNKVSRRKTELSSNFISEFKEINSLDYEIYDFAKSLSISRGHLSE